LKNVVITGANRGIGLELCKSFINKGYSVFALCRQSSPELSALDATIIENIDVATEQGLINMQHKLAGVDIDILINNAGILRSNSLDNLQSEVILEQFKVNALAPLQVVDKLKQQLPNGAKIALISSRMGSIADNSSGGSYGYRMSKTALNAAGMSLSHDLSDRQISVAIYHPGWVQTDMVNHSGDITAQQCAEKLCDLIVKQNMQHSGTFTHSNGQALPW